MSTYEERQAYRDSHPGVVVDNNSSSDGGFSSSSSNGTSSAQTKSSSSSSSGGGSSQPAPAATPTRNTAGAVRALDGQSLGGQSAETQASFRSVYGNKAEQEWTAQHDAAAGASAPGTSSPGTSTPGAPGTAPATSLTPLSNVELFDKDRETLRNAAAATAAETAYKYWLANQVTIPGLQLDKDKFAFSKAVQAADEAFRTAELDFRKLGEANAHEIATGTLNLSQLAEKHQNELGIANLGLDVMKLVSTLQADPFRQQQAINGLSAGGYSNAINAALGRTEQPVFQAPNGSAADSATLPALAARLGSGAAPEGSTTALAQAANGAFSQGATSGGSAQTDSSRQYDAALAALPESPTGIVARNLNKMDPTTQAYILSGMSAKTGFDMPTVNHMIQATLPKFKAPSGMVASG